MSDQHVVKRESSVGRWVPAAFYALNIALGSLTGLAAEAWDLLYLAVLPLPLLALYLWRTR